MITVLKNTNLLVWFEQQTEPTGIVHQCNCFHTMGGGIARQISEKYPEALIADKLTPRGDRSKLGTFTLAHVSAEGQPDKFIFNLYGQFEFGMGRHTSYDALVDGLEKVRIKAGTKGLTKLGIPVNMGSRLGGGNWNIVRAIIDSIFADDKDIQVVLCQYDP